MKLKKNAIELENIGIQTKLQIKIFIKVIRTNVAKF